MGQRIDGNPDTNPIKSGLTMRSGGANGYEISSQHMSSNELSLSENSVIIWEAALDGDEPTVQRNYEYLSADERARAERFRFMKDRDSFVQRRGLLRAVLSWYTNVAPHDLEFCYNSNGKPALSRLPNRSDIEFSTTRSENRALIAIASGRRVGVDLEIIHPEFAYEELAERFFSPNEYNAIQAMPTTQRRNAFFACWTRKEAYVKALGKGLSIPLDVFEVTINPKHELVDLKSNDTSQKPFNWSIRSFVPWPGYIAALCTEGHDWRLERHTWRDQGN